MTIKVYIIIIKMPFKTKKNMYYGFVEKDNGRNCLLED